MKRIAALLYDFKVTPLLSPPYFPRYNGAIEAGIGAFKTRAHLEAARHGHPLEWNCNDVESARLQANAESRPWGFAPDSLLSRLEKDEASFKLALSRVVELEQKAVPAEKVKADEYIAAFRQVFADDLSSPDKKQAVLGAFVQEIVVGPKDVRVLLRDPAVAALPRAVGDDRLRQRPERLPDLDSNQNPSH